MDEQNRSVFEDSSLLPDEFNEDPLNTQDEKKVMYLIRMGLVRLNEVPEHLRSCEICRQAMQLHPEDAKYVPDGIKGQLSPEEQRKVEEEKSKENDREAEKAYRDNTGDYNHDGKTDWKDRQLSRHGQQYLGIE